MVMRVQVLARHLFHAIFEGEFLLLDGDFFEVVGGREAVAGVELVESIVELVMLFRELPETVVGS
jgi:hypothetical protein